MIRLLSSRRQSLLLVDFLFVLPSSFSVSLAMSLEGTKEGVLESVLVACELSGLGPMEQESSLSGSTSLPSSSYWRFPATCFVTPAQVSVTMRCACFSAVSWSFHVYLLVLGASTT